MLAIGRALMSKPDLALMDEPTLSLAPLTCLEIIKVIRDLRNDGKSIVLVEKNACIALGVADKGYVVARGEIILQGTGSWLLNDPAVKKGLLGRIMRTEAG